MTKKKDKNHMICILYIYIYKFLKSEEFSNFMTVI